MPKSTTSTGLRPRPAGEIMTAERLACFQPSRLSASRALMALASRERWAITPTRFTIDDRARGVACYRIDTPTRRFSFAVYSFEPSGAGKTGRIIGRVWDMMGALVEDDIGETDFERTREELPKLYEGRATPGTLIWCRANRSGRLFDRAVEALAAGQQPDTAELAKTCYLQRNTGLDGNGTFGTRSFLALEGDHPLRSSLAAQMLSAYMMRVFAHDLVHHLARAASPRATELDPALSRFLGLGNGSALGLIFFVYNHPRLIDRWIGARETAIAAAKALDGADLSDAMPLLLKLLDKAIVFRDQDRCTYEALEPSSRIADDLRIVRREASDLAARLEARAELPARPLAALAARLDGRVHHEALETLHSIMIELVPELADRLSASMAIDEEQTGRPEMAVSELREIVRADYGWAFDLDLVSERSSRYVWYKSVVAEEPRRGPREEVENAHNLGQDIPRMVVGLDADLAAADPATSVARFLALHPHHRAMALRAQALHGTPYHTPHADIMSEDFVPAHLTRLINVCIHGIDKTRDYLNRNLRGVLFHGAPTPADLASGRADPHWFYPAEPTP